MSSLSEQMNVLRQNSSGTWAAISAMSCVIDDILSVLSATEMKSVVTPPDSIIELCCLVFPVLLYHGEVEQGWGDDVGGWQDRGAAGVGLGWLGRQCCHENDQLQEGGEDLIHFPHVTEDLLLEHLKGCNPAVW